MIYADRKTKEILSEVFSIIHRLEGGAHDDHMLWARLMSLARSGLIKTGYSPTAFGDTFMVADNDGEVMDTRMGME